jgi:phage terminase small subunit
MTSGTNGAAIASLQQNASVQVDQTIALEKADYWELEAYCNDVERLQQAEARLAQQLLSTRAELARASDVQKTFVLGLAEKHQFTVMERRFALNREQRSLVLGPAATASPKP